MRNALHAEILAFIRSGRTEAQERDDLLLRVATWQARSVEPFARLMHTRRPKGVTRVEEIPALPTDVYKYTRVAAHPAAEDVRVFRTSGTTLGDRGQHSFRDLSLYDEVARSAAAHSLFPDAPLRLVILAAHETEAPDSSLSYMLCRFVEWFAPDHPRESTFFWRDNALCIDELVDTLQDLSGPVALLGTSFAFVFALDALRARGVRFQLPSGSRLMQTGGFKGRTREIAPLELRAELGHLTGIPDAWMVAEYGMTELSSQMYETTLCETLATPRGTSTTTRMRRFVPPPWVRVDLVDPVTLAPTDQPTGLIRIFDLANLDSCAFVQTSDMGQREGDGFIVLGRAPGSTPRGCSLAIEEALG